MYDIKNEGISSITVVIIIIVIIVVAGFLYYYFQEPEEGLGVKDCGTTDNLRNIENMDVLKSDSVLICLGESLMECNEAKAVINNNHKGSVLLEVSKQGDGCDVKMSLGDAEQILGEEDKQFANKYIQCPVGTLKDMIIEFSPDSPEMTSPGWGFNFFMLMGDMAFVSEWKKAEALEYGCSGTLLD